MKKDKPADCFIRSLEDFYKNRGFLSKKQLAGLRSWIGDELADTISGLSLRKQPISDELWDQAVVLRDRKIEAKFHAKQAAELGRKLFAGMDEKYDHDY